MPARFDDELQVTTRPCVLTGARIVLRQEVHRGADLLFAATVTLACLTERGTVTRLPAEIRRKLARLSKEPDARRVT